MAKNNKTIDKSMYDAPYFPKLKSPWRIFLDDLPFKIEQYFRNLKQGIFNTFVANYTIELLGIYSVEFFFILMILFLIMVSFFKKTTEHLQGYLFVTSLCTFFLIINKIFLVPEEFQEEDIMLYMVEFISKKLATQYINGPLDFLLEGLYEYMYFRLKGYDLSSEVSFQPYVYIDYKQLTEKFDGYYSRNLLSVNFFAYLDKRERYLQCYFAVYGDIWSWIKENRSFSFFFFHEHFFPSWYARYNNIAYFKYIDYVERYYGDEIDPLGDIIEYGYFSTPKEYDDYARGNPLFFLWKYGMDIYIDNFVAIEIFDLFEEYCFFLYGDTLKMEDWYRRGNNPVVQFFIYCFTLFDAPSVVLEQLKVKDDGTVREQEAKLIYYIVLGSLQFIITVILAINYIMAVYAEKGFFSESTSFLCMLAFIGIFFFVLATDFIFLYLAIELISLSLYATIASDKSNLKSVEAGLKYFVLGSFSSIFFLFGVVILYGFFGTVDFDILRLLLLDYDSLVIETVIAALFGFFFILFAIFFKLSLVPFHFVTPDVYEGAPFLIMTIIATIIKLPFILFLFYFFLSFLISFIDFVGPVIWFLALMSLLVGALGALSQNSIKRFLAYTSISNIGFSLFLLKASSFVALVSMLYYFLTYTFVLIIFLISFYFLRDSVKNTIKLTFEQIVALSYTTFILGFFLLLVLLSFSGLPPLPLFLSKYFLFSAILAKGSLIDFIIIIIFSSLNFYVGI